MEKEKAKVIILIIIELCRMQTYAKEDVSRGKIEGATLCRVLPTINFSREGAEETAWRELAPLSR